MIEGKVELFSAQFVVLTAVTMKRKHYNRIHISMFNSELDTDNHDMFSCLLKKKKIRVSLKVFVPVINFRRKIVQYIPTPPSTYCSSVILVSYYKCICLPKTSKTIVVLNK
jgi:hypothetical protein